MDNLLPGKNIFIITFSGLIVIILLFHFAINLKNFELFFGVLNDQVGYLGTARNYYLHGLLNGQMIFTPYINSNQLRLYMPGYFLVLAVFYHVFGFSILASVLPSLMGYFFSAILIYKIGEKIYSKDAGFIAALLFLFYPLNIFMAFPVMTEMVLTFVCLSAFAVFLYVPLRWKYIVFPIVLTFVYLFRQIGILIAIPMLAVYFDEYNKRLFSISKILFSIVAAYILITSAYFWQVHSGFHARSLLMWLSWANSPDYGAILQAPTHSNFLKLLYQNISANLYIFTSYPKIKLFYNLYGYVFFITAIFFSISLLTVMFYGFYCYKKDLYVPAVIIMTFMVISSCVAFYTTSASTFFRMTLFTYPFLAIIIGKLLVDLYIKYSDENIFISIGAIMLLLVCLTVSACYIFEDINRSTKAGIASEAQALKFISGLPIKNSGILVSPAEFSMSYIYLNYPQRWAFVPSNKSTLSLLNQKYPIGTLILPSTNYSILKQTINQIGLSLVDTVYYQGSQYMVFNNTTIGNK